MKTQSTLILALLFALIIAVLAILNVKPVPVHYLFGQATIPLILIILGSALLGGLMVGMFGFIRQFQLKRKIHVLEKRLNEQNNAANPLQYNNGQVQPKKQVPPDNQTLH